jgi:SAM-dependent methyltransferase
MNNYQFCAAWVRQHARPDARILDYGCGRGEVVKLLRTDRAAFGCDVFVKGGDYHTQIEPAMRPVIRPMNEDGIIPFDDDSFDVVISNQVMEHVENLDLVLSEIRRVARPGAVVLSLFPDKSVWREGHCGIPFVHWLPPKQRFYYAYAMRSLGLGHHKQGKTVREYARYWSEWIDKWTCYRPYSEIRAAFSKHLGALHHLEDEWLDMRLGRRLPAPASVKRLFVRRMGGIVFWCSKPS